MNLTRVLPSNRNQLHLDRQCKLTEPIEIGHFSVDGEGEFHADRHQLYTISNYRGTEPNFDLKDGYEDRHIQYQYETRFKCLLRWMLMNKNLFISSVHKEKIKDKKVQDYPDFIFLRGRPVKLICTPYENRQGWKMACQKLHETIYIIEIDTEKYEQQDRLVSFRGKRFEGYMTQRAIDQESYVVNEHEAFYSVLQSTLNLHHSFVYGSEIDCRHPDEKMKPPDCYIELKTNRIFTCEREKENFYRSKALKWWAQCYFACVPQITCGFRDDDGFVRTIDTFSTWELPRIASRLRNSWDPLVCLNFLDVLLTDIKELFRRDKSVGDSVILLQWSPGDRNVCYRVSGDKADKFLPDWYIEEVTSWQTT